MARIWPASNFWVPLGFLGCFEMIFMSFCIGGRGGMSWAYSRMFYKVFQVFFTIVLGLVWPHAGPLDPPAPPWPASAPLLSSPPWSIRALETNKRLLASASCMVAVQMMTWQRLVC